MIEPTSIPAPTILNVDDYPISREAISLILKQEGFAPIEAKTGAEALRYVSQVQEGLTFLDLVLLDVNLPDINGYEVCSRLKQIVGSSAIPVLMISGVCKTAEDKTKGMDSGADAYLTKPFEHSELIATIKGLLRIREDMKETQTEAESEVTQSSYLSLANELDTTACKDDALTHRRLRAQVAGDERGRAKQLLGAMLNTTTQRLVSPTCQAGESIYYPVSTGTPPIRMAEEMAASKQAQLSLLDSEPLNRAILSSLPAHIAVIDRDGFIIALNDAWERLNPQNTPTGVLPADVPADGVKIGMNYLKVCESAAREQNEVARDTLEGLLSVLRRERDEFILEYPCHSPGHTSESTQWYLLSATPLPEAVGGAVVSHLNITIRVRAEEERDRLLKREQEALAQAEALSQMRDEFLTTASHELRAPLHAILGWAKLLRRKTLSEEDTNYALETIERSALAQSHILSDILDMSQVITGKLRLDMRTFDPILIVEAAIDTARPGADAKRVSIESVFDTSIKEITGDPDRIQQITWNLISNAVKFTPPGGKVKVQLRRSNPDRVTPETGGPLEEVEIVVQDSGAGIKPEFLPYVFDPFRQEDGSKTRKYGGLGLGLAIVRRLAELHGGEAIAESTGENQGATFTVRLPVASGPAWTERGLDTIATFKSRGMECERDPQLEGVRILVVDDEPDSAALTCHLLHQTGADVKIVNSAAEALSIFERYQKWRPDILISVLQTPGIDGYSLMRKVREIEWGDGGNIPAIALTDFARVEDRIRALDAGFHIQIAKPVDPNELLAVVESLASWNA